jgi:hypothetical protein
MALVGQGSSTLELLYGSISGMAFGLVSPLASQPFDTLKTKMQAESRFAQQSMGAVSRQVMRVEGFAGLYRGIVPIVASTGVQKSALFSANAGARRACERSGIAALSEPIPFTSLSPSVLIGGVAAGTARTIVETPFELAKVRYQTGGAVRATTGLLSMAHMVPALPSVPCSHCALYAMCATGCCRLGRWPSSTRAPRRHGGVAP